MSEKGDGLLRELRAFGLSFPGAHGKAPWPTHDDLAVNNKTFAYLPTEGEPFSLSCKLPYTGEVALDLPYAKPTAYGLGKSGWVSFTPSDEQLPSLKQLKEWVEESYRAQAPRSLVKALDNREG
jgi:predicted DNA-binding protein (MmcQ/YjbR family)